MNIKTVRIFVLFALLGVSFFGAVQPAQAIIPYPQPYCMNPEMPHLETLQNMPQPPAWHYNDWCKWGPGYGYVEPAGTQPAELNLYNGFVSATIYGIPGVDFKAFLYTHVPHPTVLPEGWYTYGYGVDIFFDNANVNPEGLICFALPDGVAGNFELGVYAFDGQDFHWQSSTNCASFTGGGTFFLLMQTDPARFFWPPDVKG